MRFQPAPTKIAKRSVAVRTAGDIDLTGHAVTQPFLPGRGIDALNLRNFPNKLMTWRPVKIVVPAQNLHVRVADSGPSHANESPASPQPRQRLRGRLQFPVPDDKTQHQVYFSDFSGKALRLGVAMRSNNSNLASRRMSRRSISWQATASSLTVSVMVLMRFSISTICRNASKASRGQLTSLSSIL